MRLRTRTKRRLKIATGATVAALLVGGTAGAVVLSSNVSPPPPASAAASSYYAKKLTETVLPTPTVQAVKIDGNLLRAGTKSVFFGDSWTEGYAAEPMSKGFAYLTGEKLGWVNDVQGSGGTGYVNPGPGNKGTYPQRIDELPGDPEVRIVILQGSINDLQVKLDNHPKAIQDSVAKLQAKYPAAQVVILGPAPATLPAPAKLHQIDSNLRAVALAEKLPYISPMSEFWISAPVYEDVIDVEAVYHPSTNGHAFLANKMVAALKALVK